MKVEKHGGRVLGPVYAGPMQAFNCHKGKRFKILKDLNPSLDEDGTPKSPQYMIKLESGETIEVFSEEIFADDPDYYAGIQSPINLELIRETRKSMSGNNPPEIGRFQEIASQFVERWKS